MTVTWPANTAHAFGSELIQATHDLHQSAAFSDEGLARILDDYPRSELGIWTFGDQCEGMVAPIKGRAPEASGAEILDAVKNGKFWLNLRKANLKLDYLEGVGDDIFNSLGTAAETKLRKQDMGLLISSPKIHVHYHLDIPLVALFQIRGEKRLWLYPRSEVHAPSEMVEDIVLLTKEEELPFRDTFDQDAQILDLKPGMAITWPQAAPHRVENADCMNVSLSCEYMTLPALINANAIYANSVLRRKFGFSPVRRDGLTPGNLAKTAFARAIKLAPKKRVTSAPTPVTFELDPNSETFARPVERV